jgi:hypothetical protein
MAAGLLWLGLNPQPVLDTASPVLSALQKRVATVQIDFPVVKRIGNDTTSPSSFPRPSREGVLKPSPLAGKGSVRGESQ